jgi:hypothetical protein
MTRVTVDGGVMVEAASLLAEVILDSSQPIEDRCFLVSYHCMVFLTTWPGFEYSGEIDMI